MRRILALFFILFFQLQSQAQFAPQVGKIGSTAIHKDSNIFVSWATSCTLNRGWLDISDTTQGKATVGDASYATGKPGNGIVSLGDGGDAVLTFAEPIKNGPGFDFAVFENGFLFNDSLYYLELAFVEVSSNGIDFYRFPATSYTDTSFQMDWYQGIEASKINNLAGKYVVNYGTPFNLEELAHILNLDINNITHIKIVDVVGSVNPNFATRDANGNMVNDPWPTPFPSSGFDLEAVGVINRNIQAGIKSFGLNNLIKIYPNPVMVNSNLFIKTNYHKPINIKILNALGAVLVEHNLSSDIVIKAPQEPGIYFVQLEDLGKTKTQKIIVY